MRKSVIFILILAVVLTSSMVAFAENGEEDSIVIGMGSDGNALDPRYVTTASGMYVSSQIFNGLLKLDKNLEYQPDLAEFEMPSDSEYVFHLKEGVYFHDGTELTAEDVKYTYESMLDPDKSSPKAGNYLNIIGAEEFNEGETDSVEGIEIIDEYTISFQLEAPHAPFLVNMNTGIVPKHLAENNKDDFEANPVGTGPFMFESREIDEKTVLVANDDYFEGRPNIDSVEYRIIPESAAAVIELETGVLDVLMSVSEDDLPIIEDDDSINLASIAGTNYNYIGFNVTNKPVDNKYLRKAIAYSLDKDSIAEHFHGTRTHVPLPGSHPWVEEFSDSTAINQYEYDMDRAQEMLAEGDYDGETVTIKTSEGRQELAQIMQQMMSSVGIDVEIELLEWGTFYDDVVEGDAEIYLLGWYGIIDPDAYWFFHSDMTPPQGGSNRMYYSNEKADELLIQGREEVDEEERKAIYHDLYEVLTEDLPMIFLYSEEDSYAYRDHLEGFEAAPYPVTILKQLKNVRIVD
ncbi:ABC transporter substrate-binding protein [Halanaerobiaceae bacterium Z-7014]|uniref:ABC transporter substrate-binding protein n=1 Tax=Halonatronomonas betaini TaxID=2778430 RepID=A0A931F6X3_9FIRM|nr:ABC transporter substrate-binding protein [Halonatronomonas betaini]MBF8437380.1 ABC transporter substrate-binding protein [Halonatronomonas betaini]